MTISLSFTVAIVLGPVFAGFVGVPGIFWLTAILAVLGIVIAYGVVPGQVHVRRHLDTGAIPRLLGGVIRNGQLLRLDLSIFALHLILTASFLAIPSVLSHTFNIPAGRDWIVYLPVLAVSVVLMVPAIIVAEKCDWMKEAFLVTIALIAVSQLILLFWSTDPIVIALALVGFFTGFNIMEASLPSLITKIAPANRERHSDRRVLELAVPRHIRGRRARRPGQRDRWHRGSICADTDRRAGLVRHCRHAAPPQPLFELSDPHRR